MRIQLAHHGHDIVLLQTQFRQHRSLERMNCARKTRVVMDREVVVVLAGAGDGVGEVLAILARGDRQGF